MSLYLADYIVLKDGPAKLQNSKEVAYQLKFPKGLVNNKSDQSPILSFRARGGGPLPAGTVRVSIDDDGDIHEVITVNMPPGETREYKEVVGPNVVNGTGDNSVRFRHMGGAEVTISDVVIWFQRRVEAEPG